MPNLNILDFKDYFNKISCPLCNEPTNFKILYPNTLKKKDLRYSRLKRNLLNTLDDYRIHAQIVKCLNCNFIFTNPMENISRILKGYKDVIDTEYLKTEKYRKILATKQLNLLEKFKDRGNLLDIGCFAGFFLEIAKNKKWKTYGIEPSRWARKEAEKRKIKIIGDDIYGAKLRSSFFDAITMLDVIEHLSNPKAALKKIYKSLKPEGIILIGTPNIDCLISKILGKRFPFLVRMHLLFFSPKTLKRLLKESGFEIIYLKSYGRTFPIYYILERIKVNNHLYKKFKRIMLFINRIANLRLTINLGDSFVIIAKKPSS